MLVVDDNSADREAMKETLESFGYLVHTAGSSPEAVSIVEQFQEKDPFHLVLMDWDMPEIDGLEAVRLIKSNPEISHPPAIIIVTAYGAGELIQRSNKTGAYGFLIKPVTPSVLLNSILNAMKDSTLFGLEQPHAKPLKIEGLDGIQGAHILVVEDNEINQQIAAELLKQEGLIVTMANHGKEALEIINALKPDEKIDAILMDVQMHEMDGHTATRKIRKLAPPIGLTPIIAMTAHVMQAERDKCQASGMDDFITKPIDQKTLFRTLLKWIPPIEKTPLTPFPKKEISAPAPFALSASLQHIDLNFGLLSVGGNGGLYAKLLKDFVADHGEDFAGIEKAVADGDFIAAANMVHGVKGASGGLGAHSLFESSQLLEDKLRNNDEQDMELVLAGFYKDFMDVMKELQGVDEIASQRRNKGKCDLVSDFQKIMTILDRLEDLARQMDPDAEDKAEEAGAILDCMGSPFKEMGKRLIVQASNLDFSDALNTVIHIRTALLNRKSVSRALDAPAEAEVENVNNG